MAPSRTLEWTRARSNPQKTALGALVILGLVLASPVVWVVAAVAFVVALFGLIFAAIRRHPVRIWVVAGGAALVAMMVFGTFVNSIYGPIDVEPIRVSGLEEPVAGDGLERPGSP